MGARRSIDLITIDLGLPGMRKREGLRDLRVKYPEVRIVVVTASRDREMVLDALGAGGHGYIPKDFPVHEMADALRTQSEERRAGKAWCSTCCSRWSPYH